MRDWSKIDVGQLLPHDGNMVLLDQVLNAEENSLSATLTVRNDGLFDQSGSVPSWVVIEYMAQTIAAFAGAEALRQNKPVELGFLLGTRRMVTQQASIPVGTKLTVEVDRILQDPSGMAVFDCSVKHKEILASARLNVFVPPDIQAFLGSANPNNN